MKKGLTFLAMGLLGFTLYGCQDSPVPEVLPGKEPAPSESVDPLTEAKKKLFEELGINEVASAPDQGGESLPVVLPTPPELPKTDADLTE